MSEDIMLDEWHRWCEDHKDVGPCPCKNCMFVHPANALRLIHEVKQMTCIAQTYMKELQELRKEVASLKAALQEKANDIPPSNTT